jgi:thiamine kinase-like enzyme
MNDENKISAEELAAESVAIQVPKEEDVRAEIITEYGFDETVDGERIDKLVAKEIESKKMLSKTIAQKIKHRTEAEELRKKSATTPTPKSEVKDDMSLKDIRALQDVHDDDVESVVEWAKFKKISVAEAKKSPHIQTLLRENNEFRKTAEANNTGTARRGSTKVSDEDIVANAEKDQVPEDPEVLAKARWNLKTKRLEK